MTGSFSFWTGPEIGRISAFTAAWQHLLPGHTIFGDSDVIPLIERLFNGNTDYITAYRSIRIPAAKADIARYLILYVRGGLYLDVHFGNADAQGLHRFLAAAQDHDCTLVDVSAQLFPRDPRIVRVLNSVIISRPGHPFFLTLADRALARVHQKRLDERDHGFQPYHIFHLTGPGLVNDVFFDDPYHHAAATQPRLKPDAGRVLIVREEDLPMTRNVFKSSYGSVSPHWSRRQLTELLCDPV